MISTSERTCRFKSSARRCTKPGCRLLKDHPWSLLEGDKQITARVNGHAVGLRATIALLCDIIIAAEMPRLVIRMSNPASWRVMAARYFGRSSSPSRAPSADRCLTSSERLTGVTGTGTLDALRPEKCP